MLVIHADGLEQGVDDGGTDEFHAALLEFLGDGDGFRRDAERGRRASHDGTAIDEGPEPAGETSVLRGEREEHTGVGHDGREFAAMTDEARVPHPDLDLRRPEARDLPGVEVGEDPAVTLALTEHREPSQAGLRALEDQLLEQQPVIVDGHAPLVVMIRHVERVIPAPGAALTDLGHLNPWSKDRGAR